ncbi:MAG: YvcK family protein [Bacillota bacterium]|nr:YvcK family protein [Bacillota bacterium]
MASVVVIGGGTGLSVLLRGLKEETQDITAVVTVADDGGGSGVLREDLGMLPPGDIRSCILALANREPVLQDLFQYRFQDGRLKGQSFGNLMIAAMLGISENFEDAIKKISDIFSITGEVYPVSSEPIVLSAMLEDGTCVVGESNIPHQAIKKKSPIASIWIDPADAHSYATVVERIVAADAIVIGPGSLFTSVIPNLLVDEVVEAVNRSKAKKFFLTNLMTQPGETDGMSAGDYLRALLCHTKLESIDAIVANDRVLNEEEKARYEQENSTQSLITAQDREYFAELGIELITDDLIAIRSGYVVHAARRAAALIMAQVEKVYLG